MEPILYIIARNDLDSMNPGKLAAQVAHGATKLAEDIYKGVGKHNPTLTELYEAWIKSGGGFGTTITLESSRGDLRALGSELLSEGPYNDLIFDTIVDPTYPFLVNKEYLDILLDHDIIVDYKKIADNKYAATRVEHTCSYLFGDKDVVGPLVSNFNLYK